MLKRLAVVAGSALALCLGSVPLAFADETLSTGPFDYTNNFITPFEPGAFTTESHRSLLLSPLGRTGRIDCHTFHGTTFKCTQTLSDGTVFILDQVSPYGLRSTWISHPGPSFAS
ncbi:hypothetical protein ABH922_003464 [Rhodococcus sp. 27YEA15]|uniref:hypothetical protein n=1 Tax=Rhodococcus sp. 27YEA15 TaxID=3156259 RepID=UPI003C7AD12C